MTSYTVRNDESSNSLPSDLVKVCPFVSSGVVKKRVEQRLEEQVAAYWGVICRRSSVKKKKVVVDVLVFCPESDVGGPESWSATCYFLNHQLCKTRGSTSCGLFWISDEGEHARLRESCEEDSFFFHSELLCFVEKDYVTSGEEVTQVWVAVEVSSCKP